MVSFTPQARLFYAASSRIFGRASTSPQTEQTPFSPVCAYGISKIAGIHLCRIYRYTRAMFVSAGILYNHESPMRSPAFVTRKLSQAAARASLGMAARIKVRDGSALVDWGAAEDYVRAMADILALPEPDEFIVATGVSHTVRHFAELAFAHVGLDARDYIEDASDGAVHEAGIPMCGDSSKLREKTGWSPRRSLAEIAGAMVDADREILRRETAEPSSGQSGKPYAR
jgi:GDPmannose 4,6-dehydratase